MTFWNALAILDTLEDRLEKERAKCAPSDADSWDRADAESKWDEQPAVLTQGELFALAKLLKGAVRYDS